MKEFMMKLAAAVTGALVMLAVAVFCLPPRAAEPVSPADKVRGLVERLDDNRFEVRTEADRELRSLGVAVVPLLKKEMERRPALEVYRRLENIVTELSSIPWKTSISVAQEEATRTGKPILVFSTIGDVDGFA
jgi:hypothetical protein